MDHNIDTKAILELAEMGNEVKAYLEEQYPDVFKLKYMESDFFEQIEGLTQKTKIGLLFCGKNTEAVEEIKRQTCIRLYEIIKPFL